MHLGLQSAQGSSNSTHMVKKMQGGKASSCKLGNSTTFWSAYGLCTFGFLDPTCMLNLREGQHVIHHPLLATKQNCTNWAFEWDRQLNYSFIPANLPEQNTNFPSCTPHKRANCLVVRPTRIQLVEMASMIPIFLPTRNRHDDTFPKTGAHIQLVYIIFHPTKSSHIERIRIPVNLLHHWVQFYVQYQGPAKSGCNQTLRSSASGTPGYNVSATSEAR